MRVLSITKGTMRRSHQGRKGAHFRCLQGAHESGMRFRLRTTRCCGCDCASAGEFWLEGVVEVVEDGVGGMPDMVNQTPSCSREVHTGRRSGQMPRYSRGVNEAFGVRTLLSEAWECCLPSPPRVLVVLGSCSRCAIQRKSGGSVRKKRLFAKALRCPSKLGGCDCGDACAWWKAAA